MLLLVVSTGGIRTPPVGLKKPFSLGMSRGLGSVGIGQGSGGFSIGEKAVVASS